MPAGVIVPGRMRNEGWPTDGPHPNYLSLVRTHIERYIAAINTDPSLLWLRLETPRLHGLLRYLYQRAPFLDPRCVLMHQNMHFGNIKCDPDTAEITGVFNWERSAVLPVSFCGVDLQTPLPGPQTREIKQENERILSLLKSICRERTPELFATLDLKRQRPYAQITSIVAQLGLLVTFLPLHEPAEVRFGCQVIENALEMLGL